MLPILGPAPAQIPDSCTAANDVECQRLFDYLIGKCE